MTRFKDLSLRSKLLVLSTMSAGVALLLAFVALLAVEIPAKRKHFEDEREVLASVAADSVAAALFFEDSGAAVEALNVLHADEAVLSVTLVDVEGKFFAGSTDSWPRSRLAQDPLYGGTHYFLRQDLPRFGVDVDFIDADDPGSWKSKLRPATKAIYVESMTNPLLQVGDLSAVVTFAREHRLVSLIDNTFPSPVNFRPAEHGFDLSLHSCTKYLNGHSDIVAGAVIGTEELVHNVRRKLNHLGGSLDPHACFLLYRGMKTLALRVRQQGDNALQLARVLEEHAAVDRVNYPGLVSHPRHARARELFDGFSGMLSFEMQGGTEAAVSFMHALTIPLLAPSLGGVETLVTRPATTSHLGMEPAERTRLGISDGLIRVSVGIEAVEDLVGDFRQALDRAGG